MSTHVCLGLEVSDCSSRVAPITDRSGEQSERLLKRRKAPTTRPMGASDASVVLIRSATMPTTPKWMKRFASELSPHEA